MPQLAVKKGCHTSAGRKLFDRTAFLKEYKCTKPSGFLNLYQTYTGLIILIVFIFMKQIQKLV